MPTEKRSFRFDFKQKIVGFDKSTGKIEVALVPDPERYELQTLNGEEVYYDKFDDVFISLEVLKEALPQLDGKPIYYTPRKIDNADQYIIERIPHIREFFKRKTTDYQFRDVSEEFLSKLEKNKMRFVVLSIDLKGSTSLSQELPTEIYADLISLFLEETTRIVDGFNGYVLKYVGDGLMAYFPEPDFIGMNDHALDCAATMKKMIIFGINSVLKENNLPQLDFRIGLDSGEAMIKILGVKSVKIHKDLIGETVNLAAKIQSLANTNQILMGESTALNVHTFWRKKIKKLDLPEKWNYRNRETGKIYPIYYLVENW